MTTNNFYWYLFTEVFHLWFFFRSILDFCCLLLSWFFKTISWRWCREFQFLLFHLLKLRLHFRISYWAAPVSLGRQMGWGIFYNSKGFNPYLFHLLSFLKIHIHLWNHLNLSSCAVFYFFSTFLDISVFCSPTTHYLFLNICAFLFPSRS